MSVLGRLAWSKSTRIKIMITIDVAFFLLELISGFVAHSLALMADAFHMLNDIISLAIGLWAVHVAQRATTDEFTFGYVRAEIIGAFFNAVFLIALCVSIVLEALTRFVEPPEINEPKLMLIVGSAGLISNLIGFFVLGGHGHGGHSHGHDDEHDHEHDHAHEHSHDHASAAEEGLLSNVADENGAVEDVLPEVVVRRATTASQSGTDGDNTRRIRFGEQHRSRDESSTGASRTSATSRGRDRRRSSRSGHSILANIEDISIHPASFRQDIIAASMGGTADSTSESEADSESPVVDVETTEDTPLLSGESSGHGTLVNHKPSHSHSHKRRRDSSVHDGHNHTLPKKPGKKGHGHNHGDMGMNAMVLHVIGDALGNIGVMATALIIWLTDWRYKLYADPAVSLFITVIILKTSIPLTIATARILLQATPEGISVQEIRQDIEALPGVVTCHHIHVWQLSDTKLVASMHIQVSFPINSHSGEKYMELARRARKCLHGFGIHSATIQPEFCLDLKHRPAEQAAAFNLDGAVDGPKPDVCLLECIEDCQEQGCCAGLENSSKASSTRRGSDSSHSGTSPHTHNH